MSVSITQPLAVPAASARWVQLVLSVIAMMSISSPQYIWTLFTKSFQATTGAALPAIQITFSLLIVLQTFFSPLQGYLIDARAASSLAAAPYPALAGSSPPMRPACHRSI